MKNGTTATAKILGVLVWIAILLELVTLGGAGVAKFGSQTWQEMFVEFGYPGWGAFVIGALEIGGALALLFARTRARSAMLLMAIMAGALFTVLTNESQLGVVQPVIHLAALGFILWRSPLHKTPSSEAKG